MSQRHIIGGVNAFYIRLLIAIAVVVVTLLAAGWFVILPARQAAQHYQAGVVFQQAGEWEAAREQYMQAIAIDANYQDVQVRLAEVKARLAQVEATATAAAIAQAQQVQAAAAATETAQARATTAAQATATARAAMTAAAHTTAEVEFRATVTSQARATAAAMATARAAPTATAEALAALYQRALGLINLEQWPEAQAALRGTGIIRWWG